MKIQRVNAVSRGSVVNQLTLILAATHNRQRVSRLPSQNAMSHKCTNARILLENRHFLQLLGTLGAPSRRQSRLSMSLQQHEIGPGACPSSLPGYLVARASGKRHIEFRLFFTI